MSSCFQFKPMCVCVCVCHPPYFYHSCFSPLPLYFQCYIGDSETSGQKTGNGEPYLSTLKRVLHLVEDEKWFSFWIQQQKRQNLAFCLLHTDTLSYQCYKYIYFQAYFQFVEPHFLRIPDSFGSWDFCEHKHWPQVSERFSIRLFYLAGISYKTRIQQTLAKAAAVICTLPSSDAYIFRSCL